MTSKTEASVFDEMDDLDREYVECVQGDVDSGRLSAFTRFALLCGPPEGVNPERREVATVMRDATRVWPDARVHEDWLEIFALRLR